VISKVVPYSKRKQIRNPDARVFQALRIAVNDELNTLKQMLPDAFDLLRKNGRLAVISFHSGEDRIVKTFAKDLISAKKAVWIAELTKPLTDEVVNNPNASSAKLRVIAKN
jgi:16S rRNA (cytosine1402-N4)-methyltransferase